MSTSTSLTLINKFLCALRWFKERDGILEEVQFGSMIVRSIDSVLRFSRAQAEDGGQYVCVVSNDLGEDRKQVELTVFSPLTVHLRPLYQVRP